MEGLLIGLNAPNVVQIYRPTSSVTFNIWTKHLEANNNVGQKVIYSRILNSIDGVVFWIAYRINLFFKYIKRIEQNAIQIFR